MMKPKTKQEIKQEIEDLKQLRKTVDTSWCPVLDAQILILTDNLDKEQILNKFDNLETPERVLSLALYARDWLDGTSNLMMLLREIGHTQSLIDFENELEDDENNEY